MQIKTKGAEIACSRGMLLVNSAGNSGNNSWKYISAPADANSVLTIGAVNGNREIASFSSFGPSSDGRIKPEVLSQGQNVYVINGQGNIAISNGTSFSAPIIAGAAACLWEAFPTKKALEIKETLKAEKLEEELEAKKEEYKRQFPEWMQVIFDDEEAKQDIAETTEELELIKK